MRAFKINTSNSVQLRPLLKRRRSSRKDVAAVEITPADDAAQNVDVLRKT
jgi:hypothetical protein